MSMQVRVGPTDVSSLSGQLTVNTACDSPKHYSDHTDFVYEYQCLSPLEGKFVTVQKLDVSQTNDAKSFGVNEVDIFHRGEQSCY